MAQTYFGVSYGKPLILPSHLDSQTIFITVIFFTIVLLAGFKTLLTKEEKIVEFTQTFFLAAVAGNFLDTHLYPGSAKWILDINLSDLYLLTALTMIIYLARQLYLLKRKGR